MKYDELKYYDITDIEAMDDERLEKSESGKIQVTRVYIKSDVDAFIAELKQKLQDQCISCPVKMQEDDVVAELKEKADKADKVIAELKEKHKTEVKELLCLIRDKENNFNSAFDSEEKEINYCPKCGRKLMEAK